MKKNHILDRFIIHELMGPFLFGVMAFTLIMVAGGLLFKLADLIIEKGVSFSIAGRLFMYELPAVIVLTLPMSCLLAALLGFSKMSSNSEIVALKAAGISFRRICRPVLFAAFGVTLFSLVLNETVVPLGKVASQNILRYEVARQKPAMLKEQVFLRSSDNSSDGTRRIVYINKLNSAKGTMSDVVVQEFKGAELVRLTTARDGKWDDGVWYLHDGDVFNVGENDKVEKALHFESQALPIPLTPAQMARSISKPRDMSCAELLKAIAIFKAQGRSTEPLWVALHLRIAVPWACLILALIGASLGTRSNRRGGAGMGFGQSILIVFVYYVIMSMGRSLAQAGRLSPMLGAWLSNILFFICGVWLARRAEQ